MGDIPSYLEPTNSRNYRIPNINKPGRVISFSQQDEEENSTFDEFFNVFLRIKPIDIENITNDINGSNYQLNGKSLSTFYANHKNEFVTTRFSFTDIFKPSSEQEDIYESIVRPLLHRFLHGENVLLFSYGTSSSGKSYTIQGTATGPGVIPRALFAIFKSIEGKQDTSGHLWPEISTTVRIRQPADVKRNKREKMAILAKCKEIEKQVSTTDSLGRLNDTISVLSCLDMENILEGMDTISVTDDNNTVYSVWISFAEIYNEAVFDLLVGVHDRQVLKLAENTEKDCYVKGLKHILVDSWAEAFDLYRYGKNNLHISATLLNKKSSRSHCILTIKLVARPKNDFSCYTECSSFTICDLAGSERQKTTENSGLRSKESQNINKSLLILNMCFEAIRKKQTQLRPIRVPFRESKLTRLLEKPLTGNGGAVAIIVNIAQQENIFFETQQILKITAVALETKVKRLVDKEKNSKKSIFASVQIEPGYELKRDLGDNKTAHKLTKEDFLRKEIQEYKKKIKELEESLRKKDHRLREQEEQLSRQEEKLALQENRLKAKDELNEKLEADLISRSRSQDNIVRHLKEMRQQDQKYIKTKEETVANLLKKNIDNACARYNCMTVLIAEFDLPEQKDLEHAVHAASKKYKAVLREGAQEVKELEQEIEKLRGKNYELEEDVNILNMQPSLLQSIAEDNFGDDEDDVNNGTSADVEDNYNDSGRTAPKKSKTIGNDTILVDITKVEDDDKENLAEKIKQETPLKNSKNQEIVVLEAESQNKCNDLPCPKTPDSNILKGMSTPLTGTAKKKGKLLMSKNADYLGDNFEPFELTAPAKQSSPCTFLKSLKKKKKL